MRLLKRYLIIIAVITPVLILTFIRTCSSGSFKNDARRWAELSFNNTNIISPENIGTLAGEKLVINIDKAVPGMQMKSAAEISVPPDSLISKNYLRMIKDHKGAVLISSSDPALAARLWMIISQTGCRNTYILTSHSDNEAFKYKFRPDPIDGPEL